jgi:hypothetical protein
MIPGAASVKYIAAAGGVVNGYRRSNNKNDIHATLGTGLAALTTGRNDVAILSPDSHTLTSGLDWTKDLSHMVGAYGPGMMNQRSRIGHSANFATLMTVSGYGNTFANLYLMHGRGNATNLTALNITGPRNSFINCHIGGPMNATEGGTASYKLVRIQNSEQYFKNCVFGIDTVACTTPVLIEFSGNADPPRAIFDDCLFLTQGNANVRFLSVAAATGRGLALFRNCQFVNLGTAMDYGIDGTGLSNFRMLFDSRCTFMGCTDVVELAYEAYVKFGANYHASALFNGLAASPDVS